MRAWRWRRSASNTRKAPAPSLTAPSRKWRILAAEPLGLDEFSALLEKAYPGIARHRRFAVGVSGGPDSLALTKLLSLWAAAARGSAAQIHALTVDHGLRPESAAEAAQVSEILHSWPCVVHRILRW